MRSFFVILAAVLAAGCGPYLIRGPQISKDAEIEDNPTNRELIQVIESYRAAMERRDLPGLLALASKSYYERAGTTATDDDYSYEGLEKILKERLPKLKDLRLKIEVDQLILSGSQAIIDYTYHGQFMVRSGKGALWKEKSWESRMTLERVDGRWLITSGM
jgi:hypothetical protein